MTLKRFGQLTAGLVMIGLSVAYFSVRIGLSNREHLFASVALSKLKQHLAKGYSPSSAISLTLGELFHGPHEVLLSQKEWAREGGSLYTLPIPDGNILAIEFRSPDFFHRELVVKSHGSSL